MKFLNEHTHILHDEQPIGMNDRANEHTAVQLALPDNFSEKAKLLWAYYDGAAYLYEYCSKLIVTDEGLYLTAHGDGSHEAPFGAPRWVCDFWEELEKALEQNFDELYKDDLLCEFTPTEGEMHILRLNKQKVQIKNPDGTTQPLTLAFYRKALDYCTAEQCRVVCYEIILPGIDGEFMIAIWKSGKVDSGSTQRIFDCLAQ